MSIQETWDKFKGWISGEEVFTVALIVLVGVAAFGLGRASYDPLEPQAAALAESGLVEEKPVAVSPKILLEEEVEPQTSSQGMYVASKSGSKYHLPTCGGAKQIKEENKIWFDTKDQAEAAGYEPAANCKGI